MPLSEFALRGAVRSVLGLVLGAGLLQASGAADPMPTRANVVSVAVQDAGLRAFAIARSRVMSAEDVALIGSVSLPKVVAGTGFEARVSVANGGSAPWVSASTARVNLAYHWYDATGRLVVWDGLRTPTGDLSPGDAAALAAKMLAPAAPGRYTLALDVVREGTGWFSTPKRVSVEVEAAAYRASYRTYADGAFVVGETKTIPVTISNTGNVTWNATGSDRVSLSYHWYDSSGRVAVWDGMRTALPSDIVPGGLDVVPLVVRMPSLTGSYALKIDLVREGVAWFSSLGGSAASVGLRVTADFDADYDRTTAPATIVPLGTVPVQVIVQNTGLKTWPAGGPDGMHLGFHWHDANGNATVWDGPKVPLWKDVPPGQQLTVLVYVTAPAEPGTYTLSWDMWQPRTGWLGQRAVPPKRETIAVQYGVTFYGKGWGHGIGFSQWGAQGWAEGVTGVQLSGEQIVAKYFPGASLVTQPPSQPFRALLSAPSTGCIGRTVYGLAQVRSAGGLRVVNNAKPNVVYLNAAPYQTVRFYASGSTLVVLDEWSGRYAYIGDETLTVVPKQSWDPIELDQKDSAYRGNILVEVREPYLLRVVNYVNSDDYMRGSLPSEVPYWWHPEALRAQAITGRTYAAWRQSTAGDRTWDVRDDTADQCYGGVVFETPRSDAAVSSTAGKILAYQGQPIRALYSSAHGGISENVGCLLDAQRAGITWKCADEDPYLAIVEDPAEALAYDSKGQNPHTSWVRQFSGLEIRRQIAVDYGYDIGNFVSMEFNLSPGGRPISVRVRGDSGWVDLKGDRFLRTTLGLKSTLVRTTPF